VGTTSREKARRKKNASKTHEEVRALLARLMQERGSRRTPEQKLDSLGGHK